MQPDHLLLEQRRQAARRGRAQILENRQRRRERWQAEALSFWEEWRHDPLFMLGVGLYWGEGEKSSRSKRVSLSNADVRLLRTWLRWCDRFVPGVPLNFALSIHDNGDLEAARGFWRRELNVEITWVSVAVSRASKRSRRSLPYGTLKVCLGRGGLEWYTKMLVWMQLAHDL